MIWMIFLSWVFILLQLILSENGVDFRGSDGDDLRDRNDGRLASYDEAPKQQTYCQGTIDIYWILPFD